MTKGYSINKILTHILLEDFESKYRKWINKQDDKEKAEQLTKRHEQLSKAKDKLNPKDKDINKFKDIKELEELINSIETKKNKLKIKSGYDYKLIKKSYEFLYREYDVYQIMTKEAAIKLGRGTIWCISADDITGDADENEFDNYFARKKRDIYIFIDTKTTKTKEWKNFLDGIEDVKEFDRETSYDFDNMRYSKLCLTIDEYAHYEIYDTIDSDFQDHLKDTLLRLDKQIVDDFEYKHPIFTDTNSGREWKIKTKDMIATYKNGKRHGEYKFFSYSSKTKKWELIEHCFYNNGELHGPRKLYHKNGILDVDSYFKNGNLDGEFKQYYKSGSLKVEAFYKEGKTYGDYIEYYEDGGICFIRPYKDGVKHGVEREYLHQNKTLSYLTYYENGKKEKYALYFDEEGKLETYIEIKNNDLNGYYIEWKKGDIIIINRKENNLLEGEFKEYLKVDNVIDKLFSHKMYKKNNVVADFIKNPELLEEYELEYPLEKDKLNEMFLPLKKEIENKYVNHL